MDERKDGRREEGGMGGWMDVQNSQESGTRASVVGKAPQQRAGIPASLSFCLSPCLLMVNVVPGTQVSF
jgi:hypothetical protein